MRYFLIFVFFSLSISAGAWDGEVPDTLLEADWLTDVERNVVIEVNMARTDPARYAREVLEPMRQYFQGRIYAVPGETRIMTNEGRRALDECIRVLSSMDPVPPLRASRGLTLAARDHVEDTGPRGLTGHGGADGSTMRQRIERHADWDIYIGENIAYGPDEARAIVAQLLIDDGVPSRGHRDNIMNERFAFIGVAVGPHSRFGAMCVQDFAGSVTER